MTWAPRSARCCAHNGPGSSRDRSRTPMPARGGGRGDSSSRRWSTHTLDDEALTRFEGADGVADILAPQLFDLLRITGSHRRDERAVLGQTLRRAPREDLHAAHDDARLFQDAVEHTREHWVLRRVDNLAAQAVVTEEVALDVALLQELLHGPALAQHVDPLLPSLRRRLLGGESYAHALQGLARVVNLEHLHEIQADHLGAAVGDAPDEAAKLELVERLTHARPGDTELLGDGGFLQLGARRDDVARDALAQRLDDVDLGAVGLAG